MGSCDSIKNQLSDYLEKRLEPSAQNEVKQHLDKCPDCGRIAKQLPVISSMMSNLEMVRCSDDFSKNLRLQLSSQGQSSFDYQRIKRVSWAVSFAVILIAAGLGINGFLFNQQEAGPVASRVISTDTNPGTPIAVQPVTPSLVDHELLLGENDEIDIKTSEASRSRYSDSLRATHYNSKDPRIKYVDDSSK